MTELSRRVFLRTSLAWAGLTLAACGSAAAPSASPSSAKPAASGSSAPPASASSAAASASSPAAKAASASASLAPKQAGTTRLAWVAQTANQMIFPLAKDAGYFDKYGVKSDLTYINGSSTAIPALLSGDTDVSSMAGAAIVGAQAGGTDVIMVAGFLNQAIFRVMAPAAIKSIDDLKGKTVGVTKIGNADYFTWKTIMRRQGWKDNDLKFVAAEGVPGQVALLQRGDAQAIAVSPPNDVLAEKIGAHLVLDVAKLNEPEQNVGMTITRKYLEANRATALNVLKASIEAMARWKKDPAFTKGVIKKYLKQDDQRFIDVGYAAYTDLWPKAPYASKEGFQAVIDQVASQNPKAKGLKPEQMIDDSLVKELETSGFIKQIYGA